MVDERHCICSCVFMDKIFIFGGFHKKDVYDDDYIITTKSCLEFNTKYNNFKEIAGMNVARWDAACTIFEESILVSGGIDNDDISLKSVESYDVFADKWSSMPNTINNHDRHCIVVVKDKMFVIDHGKSNSEVFDNVCNKFIALKSPNS